MKKPLQRRLQAILPSTAAAGRQIASYMLANPHELPFQTAGSLARLLGVSESSVGRFCRALGYPSFKALKQDLQADLGEGPWLVGERLGEYRQQAVAPHTLELEIAALVRVHELSQTASWQAVAERLARTEQVFVAGFQTERGIASSTAHLLQYLRDGVHLVDGAAGHYADVLLSAPNRSALIVFEARRYSRHALLLCHKARAAGIAVTLVTDPFCDWAEQNADEVFRVPTDFNLFWESTSAMLSLVNLLLNDVCKHLGAGAQKRLQAVAQLHNEFVGYTSPALPSQQ
ncbi:MurR/RpiR family transcriptional regulator [Pseudomonas sp. HR96]|uniref:MurR/RpiR family transcriptional regulator n=1 Tax=Pseudomonas sp. HR96 TaxID=1027966 RepID=UPI002A756FB6|nr:MurR/RpiR family transcriptional regulator [Pseudomonas sp. HR96]WPO99355.1 MurR/RpiR family transcriptional regulator [Pseudomonas sp. HR96]